MFNANVVSTTTTLTDNGPNGSVINQAVSFTVTVSPTVADGETVTLEDASNGNAVVGTGTLTSGSATITVSTLTVGTHSIFAVYGGDSTDAASQSATVGQQVFSALSSGEALNAANVTISGQSVSLAGNQRSMVDNVVVTFNRAVTLGSGAITLALHQNVTVNGTNFANGFGTLPTTVTVTNPSGDGMTYMVSFSGASVTGQSIADGIYDILIDGTQVTDAAVNQTYAQELAVAGSGSTVTNTFYRLFGDTIGHETVSSRPDFRSMEAALNSTIGSASYLAYLDSNGDGTIASRPDFSAFESRLNTTYSGFTPTI